MAALTVADGWPILVILPAEIDITNARDIRCQLTAAALRHGTTVVIADMTATTFCDIAGLRALLHANLRAARNTAELRLVSPGYAVKRILQITGADQVLAIYDTIAEAMTTRRRTMA